eukprot:2307021-Rhodomonas_salina.1
MSGSVFAVLGSAASKHGANANTSASTTIANGTTAPTKVEDFLPQSQPRCHAWEHFRQNRHKWKQTCHK